MSRDGLIEKNLRDGSSKNISQKEGELPKIRSPEVTFNRLAKEQPEDGKAKTSRKKRRYQTTEPKDRMSEPPVRAARFHAEDSENKADKGAVSRRKQSKPELDTQTKELKSDQEPQEETLLEDGSHASLRSSMRMEDVREHSAGRAGAYVRGGAEASHIRKKKMVQSYARKKEKAEKEQNLEDFREELDKKVKREQVHQEQRKKASRLSFDDEGSSMVKGSGMGVGKKLASGAATMASGYVHGKVHDAEQDNTAVEAVHTSELIAEEAARSLRYAQNRRKKNASYSARLKGTDTVDTEAGRLRFGMAEGTKEAQAAAGKAAAEVEASKKSMIKRFWQKQRYKEAYAAAKEGKKIAETVKATQTVTAKARKVAKEIFKRNSSLLLSIGVFALLFALMATSLSSCSALFQGGGTTIIGTTYASTDEDIYAVENAYSALEDALNAQINSMESRHSGYDEYRYQVDEISHNPYHLISYFTVKYGEFTYEQVKDELEEIFREQYGISTESQRETVTETRTVRVGESLGQVVTSGYCNCPICCGQWSGGPTASGAYPTANHTIAVDASNPFVPMGTKVVMNGVEYVVEDTGNFARYGVQFDVYYGDHASASAHGHQTWEAYIADDNGSREVQVTSTQEVNRLNVTLTNHSLDTVLRNRMNEEEEKRYDLYNTTYGNRNYLFDVNSLPSYGGGGFGYQIPSEALSDERFARMIREAEKYLGYPYVWGGASPSTSFDCSGFVSWVINNCGNGWNVGRQTADGLRFCCARVSPSQAKPGDLIFFQGTYNTSGASHVGIYVGNGMMIHCGNPIQYTSIESAYWQQHFMAFGRLP